MFLNTTTSTNRASLRLDRNGGMHVASAAYHSGFKTDAPRKPKGYRSPSRRPGLVGAVDAAGSLGRADRLLHALRDSSRPPSSSCGARYEDCDRPLG